jgi:hypothetical protein
MTLTDWLVQIGKETYSGYGTNKVTNYRQLERNLDLKRCPKCGLTLSTIDDFFTKGNKYSSYCKKCQIDYNRQPYMKQRVKDNQRKKYPFFCGRKTRFGITAEEYHSLLERQGGVCGICKSPPGKKRLIIDHDHNTGMVRGLLCYKCNLKLCGIEDGQFLPLAFTYLGIANAPND